MNYPAKIWIGHIVGDEVAGRLITVNSIEESTRLHLPNGFVAGKRWRFPHGGETVFWWERADVMESIMVHDWLYAKGEKPEKNVHTHWKKPTEELDESWKETLSKHH